MAFSDGLDDRQTIFADKIKDLERSLFVLSFTYGIILHVCNRSLDTSVR